MRRDGPDHAYTEPVETALIGLGSILMGDDGIGPYAVTALEAAWEFPPEVKLLELGTPGPEFGHYLLDYEAVIVIDAVKTKGDPGEVRLYRRDEILAAPRTDRLSPHDPSLRDALLTSDLAGGGLEEVLLIGVIPALVEMGTELSPEVRAAMPKVEKEVLRELERFGISPRRRDTQESPTIWWEK